LSPSERLLMLPVLPTRRMTSPRATRCAPSRRARPWMRWRRPLLRRTTT
jgi:hypothetical protein